MSDFLLELRSEEIPARMQAGARAELEKLFRRELDAAGIPSGIPYTVGADGLYTFFMRWPLGDTERGILTELGNPDLLEEGDKHYILARTPPEGNGPQYKSPLPFEIAASDTMTRHQVPFYIADDIEGASGRIRQVLLKIRVANLVSSDRLTLLLNGESLSGETCVRGNGELIAPYLSMWLDFHLKKVRPRKGHNLLEIVLDERVHGLTSPIRIEDVEVIVEYGSYPSRL